MLVSALLSLPVLVVLTLIGAGCDRTSQKQATTGYLRINEVMSPNDSVPIDIGGGLTVIHPWVEIHNPNPFTVGLGTYTLSDNAGRPKKFRFPPGSLGPGEFLIVFLFDRDDCRADCEDDHEACIEAAGVDPIAQTLCNAERGACLESCDVPGLAAGFRLAARGENLYLYSGDGNNLVDRVGVKDLPGNVSNGLDPLTGEYGIIYEPTPGAPNSRVNLKPSSFRVLPHRELTSDCGRNIPVDFTTVRDVEPVRGPLDVVLEHMDLESLDYCGSPYSWEALRRGPPVREVASVTPELLESEEIPDPERADPAGNPVPVMIEVLRYRAFLPPAPCGSVRTFRVKVVDPDLAEILGKPVAPLLSHGECVLYGEEPLPVLVTEYQPRNTRLAFERRNAAGELTNPASTPDWIEIRNRGDRAVDIRWLGLASGSDIAAGRIDTWMFGYEGLALPRPAAGEALSPGTYALAAGASAVVIADGDGGTGRRAYAVAEDPGTVYRSTHFTLQSDRKPPSPFDEFSLVDARSRAIIDRVVLDFSRNPANPFDLLPDQAVGRFAAEGMSRNALRPGTITDCPTPGGPNALDCEVGPEFLGGVTRSWQGADPLGRDASPPPDVPVTVAARVAFDADTPADRIRVAVYRQVDGGGPEPVDGVLVAEAVDQGGPAPAARAYDVTAELPGEPEGTLVVYGFEAQDLRLAAAGLDPEGAEVLLDETTAPRISFRYLVGHVPPPERPRISEVLPGNGSTVLPPFVCLPEGERRFPDFAEIHNPSGDAVDLSGYYLTDDPSLLRRWPFPEGTTIAPGGYLALYFGPAPDCLDPEEAARYIHVTGFDLRASGEVLHLVAPDAGLRGANSVVDSLSWILQPNLPRDAAYGRLCGGGGPEARLLAPTPGAPNAKPPLFHDVVHEPVPGTPGTCVDPGAFVILRSVIFLDALFSAVYSRPGDRVRSAEFLVDRGAGLGEEPFSATLAGVGSCVGGDATICASPPEGYANLGATVTLSPPTGGGFGPVVRYRVRLVDACGQAVEAGPFSFGTTAGARPVVAVNEANRLAPVAAGTAPRPWVELFNPTASDADLSGAFLSDDRWNPRKARIPDGTAVPAGGFAVILTDATEPSALPRVDLDWAGGSGVRGTLFLTDATDRGSCRLDALSFDFTGAAGGASFGRDPDGSATLRVLPAPSPGRANGSAGPVFLRGDADSDLRITVSDMIRSLDILFGGDPRVPECPDALDADDDGRHLATDAIFLGAFLFRSGPAMPPPFPEPGLDPTPDDEPSCSVLP